MTQPAIAALAQFGMQPRGENPVFYGKQQPTDPINPDYYRSGSIEVADFIVDKNLNFCRGNVVKYVVRAGKKNPMTELEDLEKALWYLKREIQRISDNATHY